MIAAVTQKILWLIFQPVVNLIFRMKTVFRGNYRPEALTGPAILVSNHRSHLDPFFLLEFMAFTSPLWPVRLLASKRFYKNRFDPTGWILRLAGCIPIGRIIPGETTLDLELKKAKEALEKKEVMVVFPEGKISKQPVPTRVGRGVAYLAMTTGSPIIPFFIEGNSDMTFVKALFMKERIRLYVGDPFYLTGDPGSDDELQRSTEVVVAKIASLAGYDENS